MLLMPAFALHSATRSPPTNAKLRWPLPRAAILLIWSPTTVCAPSGNTELSAFMPFATEPGSANSP
jgi:hypothetical protein